MSSASIEVHTADGLMDCYKADASGSPDNPIIIFFMDGIGLRNSLKDMADRLSGRGYTVIVPNLYYRHGALPALDPGLVFQAGPDQDRMMTYYASVTTQDVMSDVGALIDAGSVGAGADRPMGCLGYCMGGAFALSAAGQFHERISVAATIHGGGLVTDAENSPHRSIAATKAKLYFGFAGIDPYFSPDAAGALTAAAYAAGIDHVSENYAGVHHGFAISDTPAFDAVAAARHWDRVERLFGEAFST